MLVNQAAENDVQRKLRRILDKMKRSDSGKLGVIKPFGKKLKVFSPEEINKIKAKNPTEKATSKPAVETPKPRRESKNASGDKQKKIPEKLKTIWNMHECYLCFQLFETKPKLIDHCKEHFDVCNEKTLKKCPLCPYVSSTNIKPHLKRMHNQEISTSFMNIKDRKTNAKGSRYYYDTRNEEIKELDIIPSIKILNKKASMDLDKKKREEKNNLVGKPKLVRKGNEWIVEKEKIDLSGHVLPDSKHLDKNAENYLEILKKLGGDAKKKGVKMLYPCNKCEKVCQNLSALTLHQRRHDPNPKPFKPRGWNRKEKERQDKIEEEKRKEYRKAKPKPIVNNHKCDPKLMEFYEQNIKGGDIEFWQFLKIYNKMDREKVNNFDDLENTTEYGIHFDEKAKMESHNKELERRELEIEIRNLKKAKTEVPKERNKGRKYVRTIKLTKVEYNKRLEIKNRLREQLASKEIQQS